MNNHPTYPAALAHIDYLRREAAEYRLASEVNRRLEPLPSRLLRANRVTPRLRQVRGALTTRPRPAVRS